MRAHTDPRRDIESEPRVGSVPLVRVDRGREQESVHRGAVVVVDAGGRVRYAAGDPDLPLYLRSAAKPLQAIPLVASGGADALGLTEAELAVMCGSHAAEAVHLEAVRGILTKADLSEAALQCGAHPPHDAAQAAALAREGRAPGAIHNNCSGKHAGMLAACRTRNWPVDTYREPDHPLQREIAEIIAQFCGLPAGEIPRGTDGCGVPTFHVAVRHLGRAFARLADPSGVADSHAAAVRRLTRAMVAHPQLVSGTGRLNTVLMSVLGDRLFCKGGAEGGFGLGLPGRAFGLAVKIEDGNTRGMGAVVVETLRQLGVVDAIGLEALAAHHHPIVRNHEGRAVGEMRAVFTLEPVSQWFQLHA